jgi:UDP-N-acetylmuramoyl-L-alanyl-D-glutamate--2,6-diaminopimelate ligase
MVPELLPDPAAAAAWLATRVRGSLHTDSRALRGGDGFLAWPGQRSDGRAHVAAALAAGAAACLVEAEGIEAWGFDDARVAALQGLKVQAGEVASDYYGQPSAVLDLVASTGTNGKTSTAWWTAQALTRLGRRCGLIGTLGVGEPPAAAGHAPGTLRPTGLTTPDAVTLHGALRGFVDAGYAACALEASSIGIVEHRLAAVQIDVALFTNFTRDHLDYHGNMAAYWEAKRALFDWPRLKAAVVNIDDPQGASLADELQGRALDLWTVSLLRPARLQAQGLRHEPAGVAFEVVEGGDRAAVRSRLVGVFNASNLLVVIGGLRALGVGLADAAAVAAELTPVPGRLQRVDDIAGADIEVVVDYAHTPDALDQVLQALRPLAGARGGRLWCVFGCGGNRDATKRPLMGAIAARGADHVVVTSDNPRDESPNVILAQVLAGVTGHDEVDVYEDRREAIAHAVRAAAAGDVVLLAGKGHEDYQEIAGARRPFSDLDEARAALRGRAGARS